MSFREKVSIITFHMKIKKTDRRAYASKASALKRMLGRGMLLEGSLNVSMRGGSEHWQLTDKEGGKTRTMYVPARHVAEVTEALTLWKEVRAALKELSSAARAAFANAFAGERAGAPRGRPRSGSASTCGSSGRRASASPASRSATIRKDAPAPVRRKTRTPKRR